MKMLAKLFAVTVTAAISSVANAALYDVSVIIDGVVSGALDGTVSGMAVGTFDSQTNDLLFSGAYNLVVPSIADITVGTDWVVNGLNGTQTGTSCSSSGSFDLCAGIPAFNIPPFPLNTPADMGLTVNTVSNGSGLLTAGFTLGSGSNLTYVDISYSLVGSPVPVPAAAWLFGSALLGLVGAGRRRTALQR